MNDDLLNQFSATVDSIHNAALHPSAWPQAMRHIAELLRAPRALLFTPEIIPQDGGFTMAHDVPDAVLAEWSHRYIKHDVWTAQGRRLGVIRDNNVVFGEELVPDAELVKTVFYREFLFRHTIRKLCTGIVFAGLHPSLPLTVCAVYRTSACADFDEADRRVHVLLTTHLSRAVGTMLQLRDAEFRLASSLQALDRLHGAVLLMGPRGNVLFANRTALAMLTQAHGLALRAGHPMHDAVGWLHTTRADLQSALDAEIRAALANDPLHPSHFAHGLRIPHPTAQGEWVVQAVPLAEQNAAWGSPLQPVAIVFLTDPQATLVLNAALLRRLYGISASECRVAQELLRGQTLQDAARQLHLGENTVKTHLHQLFEKTQTHRQQQLIRLLLSLGQHG